MKGFFSSRFKRKNFLSVDWGNEAVKIVLFRKEEKKTLVLGCSICYFDGFGNFDGESIGRGRVKNTILEAIKEARGNNNERIGGVFLSLPSNVLKARISREIYETKDEKEIISKRREGDIVGTVLKEAQRKIIDFFTKEAGILGEDIRFLDLKIIERKIDGYEVEKISGFRGRIIEFKISGFFLTESHLDYAKKIFCEIGLDIKKINHKIELLPKIVDIAARGGIYLDVGGETTQIFFVKNKKIEKFAEFNIGGKNFSRIISQMLGVREKEARIIKEKYSNGEFSEEGRRRMKTLISGELNNWFDNLKRKLFEIKMFLPPDFFLIGGCSKLIEAEGVLSGGNWKSNLFSEDLDFIEPDFSFASDPDVKFICPKQFESILSVPEKFNNPQFTATFIQTL